MSILDPDCISHYYLFFKPDDKEEQGWDVYGENAAYQRSSKGHLKNQLGSVGLGTEDELADRVLS